MNRAAETRPGNLSGYPSGAHSWERDLAVRALHVRGDIAILVQDIVVVSICFASALLFRHSGEVPPEYWHGYLIFLPLAIVVHLVAYKVAGLYGRMWRYAGVDEARRLLLASAAAFAILVSADLVLSRPLGMSVVMGAVILTTMLVGITRFQTRIFAFHRGQRGSDVRVMVLGAGDTGASLLRQMRDSPSGGMTPVGVLDDDPTKHGRTCVGLRVDGSFGDLPRLTVARDAHEALLAVPGASAALVRRAADIAEQADIPLRVLPEPSERVDMPYRVRDARAVAIEDLLGRQSVDSDVTDVQDQVRGRTVMVTGGGGSIGSELVRQLSRLDLHRLLVLDHDETHLHDLLSEFPSGSPLEPLLVDMRDGREVRALLERHQPDVIFHAAAHKHVPMLEAHPREACLTNVLGTRNLVEAAEHTGVESLVLVSTDKAAHATSVMGASKRMAEIIVLEAARRHGRRWCAVRFGNVLGSRGSVVPLFTRQINGGGPVIVTDARMTRYFMTISEAVHLVLRAGAMSRGGDLFMLEMGEPVKILDLAKRMIRLAGYRLGEDIEIRIVGARPGEQLTEELVRPEERAEPTSHPSIHCIRSPLPDEGALDAPLEHIARACAAEGPDDVRRALAEAVVGVRAEFDSASPPTSG